jgi:hypothetical protein
MQSFVGKVFDDVEDAVHKEAAGTIVSVEYLGSINIPPTEGSIIVTVDQNGIILSIIDPRL